MTETSKPKIEPDHNLLRSAFNKILMGRHRVDTEKIERLIAALRAIADAPWFAQSIVKETLKREGLEL